MNPWLKGLEIKTQHHVSYVFEKNWYYEKGSILEKSEIDAFYPNTNTVIKVKPNEFPKFIFKSPKDHTAIDGRTFLQTFKNDSHKVLKLLFQMKQKKEIKEKIQKTNPSAKEWSKTMENIFENSSFKMTFPIKVFLTSAHLNPKECQEIVENEKNMIILDKSGLKRFLSPQLYYGF